MKKCSQCGAPLPEGELFCPECGQEVQLVPDYETMGSRLQEQQRRQQEEAEKRREAQRLAAEEAMLKKRKTRKSILILIVVLAAAVVILFAVKALNDQKNYNSFDYQLKKAETAYSNSDYTGALDYVTRALALDSENLDARMLLAQIYDKNGDSGRAAEEFLKIIEDQPDYDPAYGQLIKIYEEMKEPGKIKELLDNCPADIREKYKEYICEAPQFSLPEGRYDDLKSLEITADSGAVIYYTTDGTAPDTSSKKYSSPVRLEEGKTIVRAIAVNSLGVESEETEAAYTINLKVPSAPKISPKDGSYTSRTTTMITVAVPFGYKAYYAFDQKPTKDSTPYTGPVDMLEGEHIFYAILVNEDGTESIAASATYIYTKVAAATITPSPTKKPAHSSETEKPEDVTTPTPDPTHTPTPDPTDTPTPPPTDTPTPTPSVNPTPSGTPDDGGVDGSS